MEPSQLVSLARAEDEPRLVLPSVEYRDGFLEMVQDHLEVGDRGYEDIQELAERDFGAYVRQLEAKAAGMGLPAGFVPWTTYWLVRGRRVIGECRLRHRLTRDLELDGGHIGYNIRPSEMGKGYGTLLLKLTLVEAAMLGLESVLVMQDADNVASRRVIEKNGGRLHDKLRLRGCDREVYRYWFHLV